MTDRIRDTCTSGISHSRQWVHDLERHWDSGGTLWNIRQGLCDESGLERLESLLRSVAFDDSAALGRETVAILWYMPLILFWNSPRIESRSRTDFERHAREIELQLLRILGDPAKTGSHSSNPRIGELLAEWEADGFFGKIPRGLIDLDAGRRVHRRIAAAAEQAEVVDKGLVQAIWYIPLTLERYLQKHELDGDPSANFDLRELADKLQEQIASILGIP